MGHAPVGPEDTMRYRGIRALALALACGLLASATASATATAAATGSASAAQESADAGHAVGHAGSAAVLLRLLPGSIPATSILPELAQLPTEDRPFDAGYGLATTQLNTNAALPYERSIAQATPEGSLFGDVETPTGGFLVQTAAPDNAEPATEQLTAPDAPADTLVAVGDTTATVHARWGEDDGPCVDTASRAHTETDRLAAGNAIPTLPNIDVTDLPLPDNAVSPRFRPDGGLGTLAGLLSGTDQRDNGDGALIRVPGGLDTTSEISVVDAPNAEGKAVRSTSTVRTDTIDLLPGSALGMTATVRQPTSLAVTATGDEKTSEVDFDVPTITVKRGGRELFTLDARNDTKDIPIGVPKSALYQRTKAPLASVPIVAGAAQTAKGTRAELSDAARRAVTDLFVLRLSVGGLNQTSTETDTPITGTEYAASARLLDVQLLPTRALADALSKESDVEGLPYDVPSTLAQYSLGEQTAGASVTPGGVECGTVVADAPAGDAVPPDVNTPSTASSSIPLLWAGAAAVLIGVVLLAVPFRTSRRTPSPAPRE
ncbi:MAG: hypothetical protein GEU97_22695 [Actinophytocola sp.]|nr:hypothetical protein [Actinophytocola sp.]